MPLEKCYSALIAHSHLSGNYLITPQRVCSGTSVDAQEAKSTWISYSIPQNSLTSFNTSQFFRWIVSAFFFRNEVLIITFSINSAHKNIHVLGCCLMFPDIMKCAIIQTSYFACFDIFGDIFTSLFVSSSSFISWR